MSITDKELEKISTSKGLEGTLYSHSLVVMDIDGLRKMADIYLDGLSALSSLTDKSKRCNIHSVG